MRKCVWVAIVLVIILPAMLFIASCTKKVMQTQPTPAAQAEIPKVSDRSDAKAEQTGQLQEDRLRTEADAREAAGTAFVDENIHFAFDSSKLSDQAQQILNSKADYLRTYPGVTVTVEGYCDERGTDAYNMVLGKRRAQSVKSFLVNSGISTNRLNAVSYGKKRPMDMGHDEASWAKNRRVQFVIN
jgi:peptidoglycan-associated lipoprotein